MSDVPSISVVIPAYNACQTIGKALDSIAAQTVPVTEVVVVDDGSADDTVAVIQRDYPEVCVRQQANQGPAAARNHGVRRATGDWVAFLDADDAWLPWRLEVQLGVLGAHPAAIMCCGQTTDLDCEVPPPQDADAPDRSAESAAASLESAVLTLADFAFANPVATTSVLLRRDVFDQLGGFDEQFRGPEDYELWMRVAATGEIRHVAYPLSRYRDEMGSLSRNHERFLPEVLRVLDKAYARDGVLAPLGCYRRAKANQYMGASWMAFAAGFRFAALRLLLSSLVIQPMPLAIPGKSRVLRLALLVKYLTGRRP